MKGTKEGRFLFLLEKMKKMIVGLTYDLKSDWKIRSDEPADAAAELDSIKTVDKIAHALENGGHKVKRIGNAFKLLKEIDDLDVDVVFNICEGHYGRNREAQVPVILEMHGIPFVGADGLTSAVTLDKIAAKKMFIAEGIPTPQYFCASDSKNLKELNAIGFPLIVKTRWEGTSKGLTVNSRVTDYEGLKRQVDLINKKYKQPALVEEFIRGTEFTVAVLGNENPQAMPVCQVSMDGTLEVGDKFFSYERVLSVSPEELKYVCPAKISDKLTKRLQELAVVAYKCVDCRDFGRVDFRVDEKGNPYVLEINPLPSLADLDVFNIFPLVMDSSYDEIVNQILNYALERYGLIDGKVKVSLKTTNHKVHAKP